MNEMCNWNDDMKYSVYEPELICTQGYYAVHIISEHKTAISTLDHLATPPRAKCTYLCSRFHRGQQRITHMAKQSIKMVRINIFNISYLVNYSLYPIMHTGLCPSSFIPYGKNSDMYPDHFKSNMSINNKSRKCIFNVQY